MMLEYFDNLASDIQKALDKNPGKTNHRKIMALEIAKMGRRLYGAENQIAWCGVAAPFEILNAMGITSCFVEFVGAMLASTGTETVFIEAAENSGYASDTCGYHRSVMGAAMEGAMPKPDVLLATTCPCGGGLAVLENLSQIFDKKLFIINVPQKDSNDDVNYLADQLKKMVEFTERESGLTLDKDKLAGTIEKSNQARLLMKEIFELAAATPSPANGKDLNNFGIAVSPLFGTDAAVRIARSYRDEFKARVEAGVAGVPGEKLRLMWIQNRIQFKNNLIKELEEKYQVAVVADELNDITWEAIDPKDPYRDLARRAISTPFNGGVEKRVRHLRKMAERYRINGAINPCHWGCRQGTGARGIIQESLKETGTPVLNLETDCVDSRNFSEGQLKTRLEAFVEMLENYPSPWR